VVTVGPGVGDRTGAASASKAPARTRAGGPARTAPPPPPPRAAWVRAWERLPEGLRYSLVVYSITRLFVLVAVIGYQAANPRESLSHSAGKWDGWWYVRIAQSGYSESLRPSVTRLTDWHHGYSDWAFFPGYPLVVGAVQRLTTLPTGLIAVVVATSFGLLTLWAVHGLGREFGGREVGRASALLVAAWPGSAIFQQPYSEGLFLAAVTAALLALQRERWLLAGLLGAVATATRPSGVALVVAAGAVAAVRLLRDREWRPLLAPVLSCAGAGAFLAYGWWRTGDPMVWRHAENLWVQRFDLSHKMLDTWAQSLLHLPRSAHAPGGGQILATSLVQILGVLALAALVPAVWVLRRRLTLPLAVYAAVSLVMILGYSAVGTRPRTLLAVVPAFVWFAAWRPRAARIAAWTMAPLLSVLTVLWLWRVTP